MSTHYEILGVQQDATHADIKKAYRCIMIRHHPDKNLNIPENDKVKNETITKNANRAWEVLGDSQRRREYDETELRLAKRQKRDDYNPYNTASGYDYSRYNPDSDPDSDFGSEQYAPQPPRPPSPPRKHPRTLQVLSHDWAMPIMVEGDYGPYE
ncbi:DnaJ-domain-containing protein [Macroventuria anomochaeta]|uniref:DnaJ-domain-containing protein n=1 Tax=Macroventuria anomochaeta TaxID=301207 RepID=A0ACB6RLR0_9PLEO|nr:DnaJ-domain-containing protein [Macroventuria anomochaeta]KAF2622257.1 DnaJ-domain-containing protein [Macroventuria anomochaeta]